jgi:hypothetical protein
MEFKNDIERYQAFQHARENLKRALLKNLHKKTVERCAKELGLWEKGRISLADEAELPVLIDFALHSRRQDGHTICENARQSPPPELGAQEVAVLGAAVQSRYSLISVDSIVPNLGMNVRDILFNDGFFLADRLLDQLAAPVGSVFATRIYFLPNFALTAGSPIVIRPMIFKRMVEGVAQIFGRFPLQELSLDERIRLEAFMIPMSILALRRTI